MGWMLRSERGDKVFEYLENNPVDLMILDVMLPGKDGFSVPSGT